MKHGTPFMTNGSNSVLSGDQILYTLVTEPGGEDGRDHTDKGGSVVMASFDKSKIVTRKGNDTRFKIVKSVINMEDARKEALNKLTEIDKLVLES